MPSAFAARFEQVAMPVLERWHGVSIVLVMRGGQRTDELTAMTADREYDSPELETGLPIKVTSRDWLLPISSLVTTAGDPVEPRAGMRILEGTDEYEIVPIAGKPAVERQDYRFLCHSQRITT